MTYAEVVDFIETYRKITRTPGSVYYPAPVEMDRFFAAMEAWLAGGKPSAPTQCAIDKDGTVLAVGTSLDDVILKVEAAGVKDKVYAYDLHPRPKQAPEPARRHAFIARHGTSPIESVCQWQSEEYGVDASLPPVIGRKICSNTATHTTCDPVGAVVCATHKCRCSKPLKVTCDACKTLYVPGERHGCVAKPSTEEDTKP